MILFHIYPKEITTFHTCERLTLFHIYPNETTTFFYTWKRMLLFHVYPKETTTNGVLELVGLTFESVANNSAFDNSL